MSDMDCSNSENVQKSKCLEDNDFPNQQTKDDNGSGNGLSKLDKAVTDEIPENSCSASPQNLPSTLEAAITNENRMVVVDRVLDWCDKAENSRREREKPLLKTLKWFVIVQVSAFNAVIIALVVYLFLYREDTFMSLFFDVLKYYIGATVAELIGAFIFIIKATFTSDHIKMVEKILDKTIDMDKANKKKGNIQSQDD